MGKEMKLVKRNIALGLLIMFISNLLFGGGIVVDPKTGQNVWVDQAPNGATIINISTPNGKGISVNDFKEFKTGDKGVVYINFGVGVGRSYLSGLVPANPNITDQEARIILNRVTGGNRAENLGADRDKGSGYGNPETVPGRKTAFSGSC